MTMNEKDALLAYLEIKLFELYSNTERYIYSPGLHILHEEIYNLLLEIDDSIICSDIDITSH